MEKLPPELLQRLEATAAKSNHSIAEFIERLLDGHDANQEFLALSLNPKNAWKDALEILPSMKTRKPEDIN